jgi:nitronate monooxygenase
MTGSAIGAALDAGADAVQLGTAFLTTRESGASAVHKRYLLLGAGQPGATTTLTRAFSGRAARGIENEFTKRMAGQPTLPFPLQYGLTAPRRQLATREEDGEHQALWAGANYAQCRPELTVEQLMTALRSEVPL